jgi:hypothetical protein
VRQAGRERMNDQHSATSMLKKEEIEVLSKIHTDETKKRVGIVERGAFREKETPHDPT